MRKALLYDVRTSGGPPTTTASPRAQMGGARLPGCTVKLTPEQQRDAEAFLASLRATRFALGGRARRPCLVGYVASELAEDLGGRVVMDGEALEKMTATTIGRFRKPVRDAAGGANC